MAYDFKDYAVKPETTAEYTFGLIVGEPGIICAPAHDDNPLYRNERTRLSIERAEELATRPRTDGGSPTVESVHQKEDEDRDFNLVVIARTCARSWGKKGPVNTEGKTPAFTPDEALAFLRALPPYMQIPFINWAHNLFNFVKRPPISAAEAEKLGNE